MKDEGGFDEKQMNILVDISDSRVAFTTEKKDFLKRGTERSPRQEHPTS